MAAAFDTGGEFAETAGAVMSGVSFAGGIECGTRSAECGIAHLTPTLSPRCGRRGRTFRLFTLLFARLIPHLEWRVQQRDAFEFAVFGNEEKDEPINDAQKLSMKILEADMACAEGIAKLAILRMADEALPKKLQCLLHPAPQVGERGDALFGGFLAPGFEPARIRTTIVARQEPRGVGDEPEQHEIGIDFAVEHGFEVELHAPVLAGQVIGWVEGFKAISDILCLVEGRFAGANPALKDRIGLINKDPYGMGWLYAVKGEPGGECVEARAYAKLLDQSIDECRKRQEAAE